MPKRFQCDVGAYETELERYHAINYSLTVKGIRPGYIETRGRLTLRGEYEDVPARFLDKSDRREGYGDVDDRAHEFAHLGIDDGDALVQWMKSARRPRKADFMREVSGSSGSRERMRKLRANLPEGFCACCRAPKDSEKHWVCNERAKERIARGRELAKAPIPDLEEAS